MAEPGIHQTLSVENCVTELEPDRWWFDSWTVTTSDGFVIYDVSPECAVSSVIEVMDWGMPVPEIIVRSASVDVVWIGSNYRKPPCWCLKQRLAWVFDWAHYREVFSLSDDSRPTALLKCELETVLGDLLEELPDHTQAEYCLPPFGNDDSGRQVLYAIRSALRSENCEPVTDPAEHAGAVRHTIGIIGEQDLVVSMTPDGTVWRIEQPPTLPIWMRRTK